MPPAAVDFTTGEDAIRFAADLGIVLDDWQQWLVRMLLAERADGQLAAPTGVVLVPRQNGKGVVLGVIELYGLCVAELRRQVHSAHLTDTAAEHMKWLKDVIQDNDLDRESGGYLTVYESNGKERIVNNETRGELGFVTRSKGTKRGASPQRIVFDEALFLTDEHMQAMTPGLAAQSMRADISPQVIVTSSAPLVESVTLHRLRQAGLSGSDPSMFVADWGCDPSVDVGDREQWWAANPGLGIRISPEFLETQHGRLAPQAFAVEHLGVVYEPDIIGSELPGWDECRSATAEMVGDPLSIAVDASPDLAWVSIAVAGDGGGDRVHVEVVDRLSGGDGAVGVVSALVERYRCPVWLDPRSPAAGFVGPLERAGVDVRELGTLELAKACAELRQSVAARSLTHRGQGPLDIAVAGAVVRPVGEAWVWARRSSQMDISPLVAATLAVHGCRTRQGQLVLVGGFTDLAAFVDDEED